jgi:hypothetical protein
MLGRDGTGFLQPGEFDVNQLSFGPTGELLVFDTAFQQYCDKVPVPSLRPDQNRAGSHEANADPRRQGRLFRTRQFHRTGRASIGERGISLWRLRSNGQHYLHALRAADTTCSTPIAVSSRVANDSGAYAADPFVTIDPGTYRWRAGLLLVSARKFTVVRVSPGSNDGQKRTNRSEGRGVQPPCPRLWWSSHLRTTTPLIHGGTELRQTLFRTAISVKLTCSWSKKPRATQAGPCVCSRRGSTMSPAAWRN